MPSTTKTVTSSKLLLAISGGIAAYKAPELVRRIKEQGFDVRVVMTQSAKNFVTPMSLQAVSGHSVHHDLFDVQAEAAMGHIELAKWAEIILVAPATANCIAKIAHGLADDLLTTIILASNAQLIVAPAMNQQMWANPATVENINKLSDRGTLLIGPDEGEQACGDIGLGRMLAVPDMVEKIICHRDNLTKATQCLAGKKITITAGPTVEAIDPVRFISNHSSGKMGYALAKAAISAGAKVTLVSGPVHLCSPPQAQLKSVRSAEEMLTAVKDSMTDCDIFIGCAAVADYAPIEIAEQKIKKTASQMEIVLKRNPDIISWVAQQSNKPTVVGFAAESQSLEDFAVNKMKDKNLDIICANDISQQHIGFNSEQNEVTMLFSNQTKKLLKAAPKSVIANSIIAEIAEFINK